MYTQTEIRLDMGTYQAVQAAFNTVVDNVKHLGFTEVDSSVSKNSQLALQVAANILGNADSDPQTYALINNFLYYGNNYFDIGLVAQSRYLGETPSNFEALNYIYYQTRLQADYAKSVLIGHKPEHASIVENFLTDGEVLFKNRQSIDCVLYREIDSAITAMMLFGIANRVNFNRTYPCETVEDLKAKYANLLPSYLTNSDISKLNETDRKILGLQAIEMMLICIDDEWGVKIDNILQQPNLVINGEDINARATQYAEVAARCGISPFVVNFTRRLFRTYALKSNFSRKTSLNIEPSEIGRHKNIGRILFLREWLNDSGLLKLLKPNSQRQQEP